MIKDTRNPTRILVKLIHHYRDNLCLPKMMVTNNPPFFRRHAPEKELKVCTSAMILCVCVLLEPVICYAYQYICICVLTMF